MVEEETQTTDGTDVDMEWVYPPTQHPANQAAFVVARLAGVDHLNAYSQIFIRIARQYLKVVEGVDVSDWITSAQIVLALRHHQHTLYFTEPRLPPELPGPEKTIVRTLTITFIYDQDTGWLTSVNLNRSHINYGTSE